MQPTLCSRCGKNVAVIFITKLEGGTTKNEGLCLKCAKELGIKPIDDMMKKMGIGRGSGQPDQRDDVRLRRSRGDGGADEPAQGRGRRGG